MSIDRRRFLINTSMIAAGLSLSHANKTLGIGRKSVIGIGIIGAGDRGQGLASLIREIDGLEVVAMCDLIPLRLQQALQYGVSRTKDYADYRRLLEDKSVDAVIISTPFSLHAEMAMAALDANKHVYCEKTLAYGIESTRALLVKARQSKKIFHTGHQYRSSPLYRHIVQLVKDGYLGQISLIENQWNRNSNWRRPVFDPKLERLINWRLYREYSGGLTAELCSHQIDLSNWLLEDHPQRVSGFGGIDYWKDGRETYDNVHILTQYPSGIKASFTSLTTNAKDSQQTKILGSRGSIVFENNNAWIYSEKSAENTVQGIVDGVSGATMRSWQSDEGVKVKITDNSPSTHAMKEFRDCVKSGRQPLSNAETGARVSVVVQMALMAMDHNKVEAWKNSYDF